MTVLITCNNEEDPIKNVDARVFTTFFLSGAICYHGNEF